MDRFKEVLTIVQEFGKNYNPLSVNRDVFGLLVQISDELGYENIYEFLHDENLERLGITEEKSEKNSKKIDKKRLIFS